MKNLLDRVDRLERAAEVPRKNAQCDNCRDWPPARSRTIDENGGTTDDTLDIPERCPTCGWTPVLVTFEIVTDWRSVPSSR
jgi:hypothetical protein